jgi:hypothetical protein
MWTVVLAIGVVAGGSCREAFTAHPAAVARVGDQELTADRLADILVLAQPVPLEREVGLVFAQHWINVTALGQRTAAGESLLDTAVALEALWFPVRQQVIGRYRGQRVAERVQMTDAVVDSAYRVGNLRNVLHVLRAVTPEMSPEEKQQQRQAAERIRDRLLQGGGWEQANAQSEDSVARERAGNLGPIKRGQMLPRFENVAFALGPGELSRVTETRAGFHIIYRPRLAEVRPEFTSYVAQELAARADSAAATEVIMEGEVVVTPGAADVIREVMGDPWQSLQATEVVATYQGGRLTAGDMARYIQYLSVEGRQELGTASDTDLADLVREVVLQELFWIRADSAGVQLSDTARGIAYDQYREDVTGIWERTGLAPDSLEGDAATGSLNDKVARRVDLYFEAIASRRIPMQPLPPYLSVHLLRGVDWEIQPAGIDGALQTAARLLAATQDSTP